jgi:hypothetical protein
MLDIRAEMERVQAIEDGAERYIELDRLNTFVRRLREIEARTGETAFVGGE